jgi:hypothetical protein
MNPEANLRRLLGQLVIVLILQETLSRVVVLSILNWARRTADFTFNRVRIEGLAKLSTIGEERYYDAALYRAGRTLRFGGCADLRRLYACGQTGASSLSRGIPIRQIRL